MKKFNGGGPYAIFIIIIIIITYFINNNNIFYIIKKYILNHGYFILNFYRIIIDNRHFDTNMRVFGPTIFGDPGEIHKYLDGLFDEMQKKIDLFGFNGQNSIIWNDQSNNFCK